MNDFVASAFAARAFDIVSDWRLHSREASAFACDMRSSSCLCEVNPIAVDAMSLSSSSEYSFHMMWNL